MIRWLKGLLVSCGAGLVDEYGSVKVHWLMGGAAALVLLVTLIALATQAGRDCCVDTVPAYDGRCWGNRRLVVEQGVAICRCRRSP